MSYSRHLPIPLHRLSELTSLRTGGYMIYTDSFLFNNVRVKYVGTDPDTGISLYVNDGHGGAIGVRVYPNGRQKQVNPRMIKKRGDGSKQEYLIFDHAFGHLKHILVSHAVYIAWVGPIKPGMTIDHINGITTDNRVENLRQIDLRTNMRDGGFLTKLRNKGINPARIDRTYLLRYFNRMAKLKPAISKRQYNSLTDRLLKNVVYDGDFDVDCFIVYHFKMNTKRRKKNIH